MSAINGTGVFATISGTAAAARSVSGEKCNPDRLPISIASRSARTATVSDMGRTTTPWADGNSSKSTKRRPIAMP